MDHQSSSSTKVERRFIEKNRRNQMKILYCKLNSLLPTHNSKEQLALPDQIDEAINYIKTLEAKVKMIMDKKESLKGLRKRSPTCSISPQIEIRELDSTLEIVLITGFDNQFIFYEIIRFLHEEKIEVRSVNSSRLRDSMFHVIHAEIGKALFHFGAAKVSDRLKGFVYGSTSDVEIQRDTWDNDFAMDNNMWELQ
ncbi:Transcription factor bHLH36 [Quillaja saponaria]|uniref:Transcription factor bHLH36 n=1 Tax=Quillaja saponaria TaxID=32244 RepID=A0AAD7PAE2_QUISA|nr:Transcription factor bHLH36 [Quillaja saponaria]